MKSLLKIVFWCILAVVLTMVGMLVGTVVMLTPERLTPIAVDTANRVLNADVDIQKVELSMRRSFPFLNIDIDSVTILSTDIRRLPSDQRDRLPQWADTLATINHMHGGINIFSIVNRVVNLKDLQIVNPRINVLVVNDSLDNFSILPPSADTSDTTVTQMPNIRLDHFSLIDPLPFRYADMAQNMRMTATITSAQLTNSSDQDSNDSQPIYRIDFASNISAPWLQIIGQQSFPVSFDGIVEWNHNLPYQLKLKDFNFALSQLSGDVNLAINFYDRLVVKELDFKLNPISVTDFLSLVPDSIAREYYIPKSARTNAAINFYGHLSTPYTLGTEELPFAEFDLSVPRCSLFYDGMDLHRFELQSKVALRGGKANDARLHIDRCILQGDGTDLLISGNLTEMAGDPLFDGEIHGTTNIEYLPKTLTRNIKATMMGKVKADAHLRMRPSMLSPANFHKLSVNGDVNVDNFFYLADDTLSMYTLRHTIVNFGANDQALVASDSLLSAKLSVDTADLLVSGLDMSVSKLSLNIGAVRRHPSSDTTLVIPMGGKLSARSYSIFSLSDTAGLYMQDAHGLITMNRYRGDTHLPLFDIDLDIERMSVGNNRTRFMIDDSRLLCSLGRLPVKSATKHPHNLTHIADSISCVHPLMSIDQVYRSALLIRRRHSIPHHHRVHTELTSTGSEIIHWGTTSAMTKFLLDWDIKGSLTSRDARLFTRALPLNNLAENLNIEFCNDSIALTDVKYKIGKSDFLISGNITNIRRALTTADPAPPVRINLSLLSDFIDVNELSGGLLGDTHHEHPDSNKDRHETIEDVFEHPEYKSALLIPTNIDAQLQIKATTVAYADFVMHNLTGTLLMYDGALNLHDLQASSEVGKLDLTALYSAPAPQKINFGLGLRLEDFNIRNFRRFLPAVDSIMPMLQDLSGIINANMAISSQIDEHMDFILPSVKGAINIQGDSLAFVDDTTFRKIAKWLMFKNRESNLITHVSAQMIVDEGEMRVFPFIFDIDRYRLGIQGYNNFKKDFNYHIAVLHSPLPFKFGIDISGVYGKLHVHVGGARFNEHSVVDRSTLVEDTRLNLIHQFQDVFRRGVQSSQFATVSISQKPEAEDINMVADTLSVADSAYLRRQGLIP